MLETDDIQHYLLARPKASIAQYNFITFHDAESARNWLAMILPTIGIAKTVMAESDRDMRWVSVAFTFNGLSKLGVDEASLDTFSDPFKQGMAARAQMLGDIGPNHPDHWEDKIASPDLHAAVILFARDKAELERSVKKHQDYLDQNGGGSILSTLLLEAVAPLEYVHEHFGYRDRLTTPVIEGMGIEPTPGSEAPSKPG